MATLVFNALDGKKADKLADGESVNLSINTRKNKALQHTCGAVCGAGRDAISARSPASEHALRQHITRSHRIGAPLAERPNHRGEMPVAIVTCDKTGRSRAVYPGQSAVAVAARLGAVDWTSETVGVRA